MSASAHAPPPLDLPLQVRIRITETEFKPFGAAALEKFREHVASGAAGKDWTLEPVNWEVRGRGCSGEG